MLYCRDCQHYALNADPNGPSMCVARLPAWHKLRISWEDRVVTEQKYNEATCETFRKREL